MINSVLRNDYTATGFVLHPSEPKLLLILHRKFNKWMPPGGHCEGYERPDLAVLREVEEETGVQATIISNSPGLGLENQLEVQVPTPIFILHEYIPSSAKEEAHMHVDFIFLLKAHTTSLVAAEREVFDARWFLLDQIEGLETFDGVKAIARRVLGVFSEQRKSFLQAI